MHANMPNKIIHFDYFYFGKSSNDATCVLGLKDYFSSYVSNLPCAAADAEHAAEALLL